MNILRTVINFTRKDQKIYDRILIVENRTVTFGGTILVKKIKWKTNSDFF